MRLYILDELVDPVSGQELRLENAVVEHRPGPAVEPCRHWCGYHAAGPAAASPEDCRACRDSWVTRGELVAGEHRYAIAAGVPRMISRAGVIDEATQESFGYEWKKFDRVLADYVEEADNYFGIVPAGHLEQAVVLDAGCGMGRWARHAASLGAKRLYAVDFSEAIDHAAPNLEDLAQVHCVQADLCQLPFRAATFDFTYCLGVLHHLEDPERGMTSLDRVTRQSGALLVYLYYALDNRPAFHRHLLSVVTAVRRLTSRLPKPAMFWVAWAIGCLVYWPLARLARLVELLGFDRAALQLPLSHYRSYSLRFMAGDAFDRFATPIEKRYSRAEIAAWLARHGRHAIFSNHTPFWVVFATPPP